MPDLRKTRRKVKIALAAMAIVDVVAVGIYFSPLAGSQRARREHLDQLLEGIAAEDAGGPALAWPGQENPWRTSRSTISIKTGFPRGIQPSVELSSLAAQSGVKIGRPEYDMKDPESLGLLRLQLKRTDRQVSTTGALHQFAGARPVVFPGEQRGARWRAKWRGELADEDGNVFKDRRGLSEVGNGKPQADHRADGAGTVALC